MKARFHVKQILQYATIIFCILSLTGINYARAAEELAEGDTFSYKFEIETGTLDNTQTTLGSLTMDILDFDKEHDYTLALYNVTVSITEGDPELEAIWTLPETTGQPLFGYSQMVPEELAPFWEYLDQLTGEELFTLVTTIFAGMLWFLPEAHEIAGESGENKVSVLWAQDGIVEKILIENAVEGQIFNGIIVRDSAIPGYNIEILAFGSIFGLIWLGRARKRVSSIF